MSHNFVFFYGSTSPFSNWYLHQFTHDNQQYNCSEQYMMHKKALLFNDYDVADMILKEKAPRNQKFLGREVRGFDDKIWTAQCRDIMVEGLISKFTQDTYSMNTLLDTGDKILVEASPTDTIWGIGLGRDDPGALDQTTWQGQNLLGITLMQVRDAIRKL